MKTPVPSTTHPPRRTAPFNEEPGYYEPSGLWLYGNTRLLNSGLVMVPECFGPEKHIEAHLNQIERETENLVLERKTLVTGIHNVAHQRAATVPLRWGAPRILVVSGGFYSHLGPNLDQEPFLSARLWRYEFDHTADLIVSRHAPDFVSSRRKYLPSVDQLIQEIVSKRVPGLLFN